MGILDEFVASPALAYNSFAVGALNDKRSTNQNDDIIADFSCFIQSPTHTNKPDFVAPGVNIVTGAGKKSGTSMAAPHVAGIIAQLLQENYTLTSKPEVVKAIMTASISHSVHCYTYTDSQYNRYGAGVVDAAASVSTVRGNRYIDSSFDANSPDNSQNIHYFTVPDASYVSKLRISLAWLSPGNNGRMANLDLLIYDPNNNLVASATSEFNNVEIVEFDPVVTGQYKVVVRQVSNSDYKVFYGVAGYYE